MVHSPLSRSGHLTARPAPPSRPYGTALPHAGVFGPICAKYATVREASQPSSGRAKSFLELIRPVCGSIHRKRHRRGRSWQIWSLPKRDQTGVVGCQSRQRGSHRQYQLKNIRDRLHLIAATLRTYGPYDDEPSRRRAYGSFAGKQQEPGGAG